MDTVAVTPENHRTRAVRRVACLGEPPSSPRDLARWREVRDSAAVELAAAADGNAVLLSQALMLVSEADHAVRELLNEARGYCPRRHH
jgi:hypothetical protein